MKRSFLFSAAMLGILLSPLSVRAEDPSAADALLTQYRELARPKFDRAKQEDAAYREEFAKQMQEWMKQRAELAGQFVAKYPDWLARVDFRDGSSAFFDGPKDLFRFYFAISKYAPGKAASDVTGLYVKDYYALEWVEARKAFYVIGSNVYGPMGKELVPFATDADAKQFSADHGGKRTLTLGSVTPELLRSLE